jgi:hypothetical protein
MSETHMADFCRTHKFIRWFETSARENTNIADTFLFLVNEVRKNEIYFSRFNFFDIFR